VWDRPLGEAQKDWAEPLMEFLVEFEVHIPPDTPETVAKARATAEVSAAASLAEQGHLVRLWTVPDEQGRARAVGLYRAESRAELDVLLADLPLYVWMRVTVTTLESHPNDPCGRAVSGSEMAHLRSGASLLGSSAERRHS
jgi:muconolactone D-isomerase